MVAEKAVREVAVRAVAVAPAVVATSATVAVEVRVLGWGVLVGEVAMARD